jgi:hypothetical protein
MQGQGLAETITAIDAPGRVRIERMVHEAMLTMRMAEARDLPPQGRSAWPDYVYERDDYGNRPAVEELRALVPPWRPTGRHVDEMDWVWLECFGKWPNPRSGRNGLENWQRLLLEIRAWQVTCGLRGGWRHIAEAIRSRPGMPKFGYEWARIEHRRLIDIAVPAARRDGWV